MNLRSEGEIEDEFDDPARPLNKRRFACLMEFWIEHPQYGSYRRGVAEW
jgi:hypothetical protein